MLAGRRILLIIGGGIAAYKALDLIRRLKERGAAVTPAVGSRDGASTSPGGPASRKTARMALFPPRSPI